MPLCACNKKSPRREGAERRDRRHADGRRSLRHDIWSALDAFKESESARALAPAVGPSFVEGAEMTWAGDVLRENPELDYPASRKTADARPADPGPDRRTQQAARRRSHRRAASGRFDRQLPDAERNGWSIVTMASARSLPSRTRLRVARSPQKHRGRRYRLRFAVAVAGFRVL